MTRPPRAPLPDFEPLPLPVALPLRRGTPWDAAEPARAVVKPIPATKQPTQRTAPAPAPAPRSVFPPFKGPR